MRTTIRLYLPLMDNDLETLIIGDRVLLNGVLYTARDAAHKRLVDLLENGQALPLELNNSLIFYAGPAPAPPGYPVGSIGPTTSSRMDSYATVLMEKTGVKGMIGKGKRSPEFAAACKKYRSIYFVAIAGVAALLNKNIVDVETVAYEDLGTESIKRLTVRDLPVIVANDIWGRDIFDEGQKQYRIPIEKILSDL